ncbi:MAG: META domain-containing protein [Vicinamibacterales bacterium]
MVRNGIGGVLLCAAVLVAPGCDIFTGPSSLTEAQLTGTWTLSSLQASGQASQNVPAGATYTLTIADGNLSARADCNTCAGRYTLAGTTLTAGPALACTRAACPTAAFESTFTTILGGESTVDGSATSMTLTSTRGTLRFVR